MRNPEHEQLYMMNKEAIDVVIATVAAYTVLWTLVPVRTAYYGLIWLVIWVLADRTMKDLRIPAVAIIQAVFHKIFTSTVALIASGIILVACVAKHAAANSAIITLYPVLVLCVYANLVLEN